jgi:signal transduction histidine kinase
MAFSDPADPVAVRQSVADDAVRITVSDNGPGIAPDEHNQIFEPYYQINRKKTEQQGMGIGLTLAKEIVDAHDGALEVNSVVGQGTNVTIVLPIYTIENQ